MKYTDILAWDIEEALETCKRLGWKVNIEYVSPPGKNPEGRYRVIRCLLLGNNELLITAAKEMLGKEV